MHGTATPQLDMTHHMGRVIGRAVGDNAGPTLICIGSIHGNEPAGITALQRVFAQLDSEQLISHGTLLGIAGNLSAIAQNRRYVDEDLNRIWTKDRIDSLHSGDTDSSQRVAENLEVEAIIREIEQAAAETRGDLFLVDLHTTSGHSPPFGLVADTLRNRSFALRFPVPIILGLEEHLDGTFLEYFNNRGYVTLGFEGGQHDDPTSVDLLESCIWMGLSVLNMLRNPDCALRIQLARNKLSEVSSPFPRALEVRYRHQVDPDDGFAMDPGFAGFQMVRAEDVLAHNRSGKLTAAEDSRVLLPLYQSQGADGYFLMREFSTFWLTVSATLRYMRLDSVLHWLPGVARSPDSPHTLVINRRVARWLALQVFHLLGYRRRRMDGETLIMTRRPE